MKLIDGLRDAIAGRVQYKTPTRRPELYDANDPRALVARVRELEEVVEKYRTQRIGPYTLGMEITATDWPTLVWRLQAFANQARDHGPDCMEVSGGGGYDGGSQCSYRVTLKSGKHPGAGESDADKVSAHNAHPDGGETGTSSPVSQDVV